MSAPPASRMKISTSKLVRPILAKRARRSRAASRVVPDATRSDRATFTNRTSAFAATGRTVVIVGAQGPGHGTARCSLGQTEDGGRMHRSDVIGQRRTKGQPSFRNPLSDGHDLDPQEPVHRDHLSRRRKRRYTRAGCNLNIAGRKSISVRAPALLQGLQLAAPRPATMMAPIELDQRRKGRPSRRRGRAGMLAQTQCQADEQDAEYNRIGRDRPDEAERARPGRDQQHGTEQYRQRAAEN